MLWIERVFAHLTVLICRGFSTDSRHVVLARQREDSPREPILQSGAVQTIHRLR
jgi:hypothetical protein